MPECGQEGRHYQVSVHGFRFLIEEPLRIDEFDQPVMI